MFFLLSFFNQAGLSTGADQNVSGHDWIDKQPNRAMKHKKSVAALLVKENARFVSVTSLKVCSHGGANRRIGQH